MILTLINLDHVYVIIHLDHAHITLIFILSCLDTKFKKNSLIFVVVIQVSFKEKYLKCNYDLWRLSNGKSINAEHKLKLGTGQVKSEM